MNPWISARSNADLVSVGRSLSCAAPRPNSRPSRRPPSLVSAGLPPPGTTISLLLLVRLAGCGRWRFAVGNQGMDVLNRQTGIGLIEPDRGAVCPCRKVDELLKILSAWRRRRVLREFEDEIEDLSDILGEIGD